MPSCQHWHKDILKQNPNPEHSSLYCPYLHLFPPLFCSNLKEVLLLPSTAEPFWPGPKNPTLNLQYFCCRDEHNCCLSTDLSATREPDIQLPRYHFSRSSSNFSKEVTREEKSINFSFFIFQSEGLWMNAASWSSHVPIHHETQCWGSIGYGWVRVCEDEGWHSQFAWDSFLSLWMTLCRIKWEAA